VTYDRFPGHLPLNVCGPATPGSPFELPGLGFSEFARHYFRNHGCFLFLWVLRWFTSPGSPRIPMYSECDNCCSQQLGFPIRTSPDHGLLASPRSLSQLVTSFIAYLRQGIHTHALSSLTIKLTLDTNLLLIAFNLHFLLALHAVYWLHGVIATCVAHQYSIVKDQRPLFRSQESKPIGFGLLSSEHREFSIQNPEFLWNAATILTSGFRILFGGPG
jgi:hypothetical protein